MRSDRKLYSSGDVAAILGVDRRTVTNWIRTGRIPEPGRDRRNGYYRWSPADVEAARTALALGRRKQ